MSFHRNLHISWGRSIITNHVHLSFFLSFSSSGHLSVWILSGQERNIDFAFDMNVLDSDKGQGHFITYMVLTKRRHAGEKFCSDNSSSISKNKVIYLLDAHFFICLLNFRWNELFNSHIYKTRDMFHILVDKLW